MKLRIPLCVLMVAMVVSYSHLAVARDAARPNIVFLLTDDQRFDALGCMGNPVIETPNLDRLASEGVLFRNCFCTTSICATSRASFLTGQYARRHGIGGFGKSLDAKAWAQTFPALLREAGYHTAFVGKWGLGGPLPKDQFDFWAGFSGQGRYFEKGQTKHLTRRLGDQALRFLDNVTTSQPFLLWVSFKAAHVQDGDPKPFQPDPAYDKLYQNVRVPTPATADERLFDRLPDFLKTSEGRRRWKTRFATPEMTQDSIKKYYRLVTGIDRIVGDLIAKLRETGVYDNTAIIFTSDNGFFLGERGLAGKWFMYEESIRLPLLIRHPTLPKRLTGRRVDPMVLSIDIAPTLLAFAGVPIPKTMQGRSLRPIVFGEKPPWRTEWFYEHLFQHSRITKTEGVRTAKWKYTRYIETEPVYEELFNLENDPTEVTNLASSKNHKPQLEHLRERWKALREKAK